MLIVGINIGCEGLQASGLGFMFLFLFLFFNRRNGKPL